MWSRVISILLLYFAFDIYAFQAIRTVAQFSQYKVFFYTLYWLLSIGLIVGMVLGMMYYFQSGTPVRWGVWSSALLITLLITKLFIAVLLLTEDGFRIVETIVQSIKQKQWVSLHSRRTFVSQLALGVAGIPFAGFLYGINKGKYNYKISNTVLEFADLPDSFHGFKMVQISDIHCGSFDDVASVEEGIRLVMEQEADLIVFTGDLVNQKAKEFIPWKELFSRLKANYGVYSVLGNHDYGDYGRWRVPEEKKENFAQLLRLQEEAGFKLLMDESTEINKDGQSIFLLGVQNWGKKFSQYGDLEKCLNTLPTQDGFKILLSHDPTHFDAQVVPHPTQIHLTLSGHTHGMQMGVNFPWLKWSPIQYIYPKWAGLYKEQDKLLYVNRGFGFLGFAGRVGMWPEITVFELKKAQA